MRTLLAHGVVVGKEHYDANAFTLERAIRYRNSFLPVAHVRIEAVEGGARLDVSMRLPWFTAVFMACWLLAATVGAVSVVPAHGVAPALVMPLVGVALFLIAYPYEARRLDRLLVEAVRAR